MKRRVMILVLTVIAGAGGYATTVRATPGVGFTATTLAVAQFDDIDVNIHTKPADFWQSRQRTRGASDLYIQSNKWIPGGSTGWHTHPGHSLIIVTEGTVTAYDGDDRSCTPHIYTAGMGFVDEGGTHVHVIRNEGSVDAKTMAVQLIPAAAVRRIDVPAPGNCPF